LTRQITFTDNFFIKPKNNVRFHDQVDTLNTNFNINTNTNVPTIIKSVVTYQDHGTCTYEEDTSPSLINTVKTQGHRLMGRGPVQKKTVIEKPNLADVDLNKQILKKSSLDQNFAPSASISKYY